MGLSLVRRLPEVGREVVHDLLSPVVPLRPDRLFTIVTRNCNAQCLMCNIWREKPVLELPTERWLKAIERNRPFLNAIRKLDITGGEPFCRPDIETLVVGLCERLVGLRKLIITTNGFSTHIIRNMVGNLLPWLKGRGVRLVMSVSIDGLGAMNDDVRGVEGAGERVWATLQDLIHLRQKHPNLTLSATTVITPSNIDHLSDIRDTVAPMMDGYDHMFVPIATSEVYQKNSDTHAWYTEEQQSKIVAFLRNMLLSGSVNPYHKAIYNDALAIWEGKSVSRRCPLLLRSLVVDCNGSVLPCFSAAEGDVYGTIEDDLAPRWRGTFRKNTTASYSRSRCQKCGFMCGVGYSAALVYGLRNLIGGVFAERRS